MEIALRTLCFAFLGAVLNAAAQTATSITIDGPATVNSLSTLSVAYSVTVHRSDGTTSAANVPVTTANNLSLQPMDGRFIVVGLGFTTLSASYFEGGTTFTATRTVIVADGTAPAAPPVPDCLTERADPSLDYLMSGVIAGAASDLVPMCNGHVLLANTGLNRIQLIDMRAQVIERSWLLSGRPRRIARVRGTSYAFVATDANSIARIDLANGAVQSSALSASARDIAPGEPGQVFALLSDATVVVIDAATFAQLATLSLPGFDSSSLSLAAYDPKGHRLFLGNQGYSASTLRSFAYSPADRTFAAGPTVRSGGDGASLTVSPDGLHLAYPSSGGNGSGYTIWDLDASNITTHFGEWPTGAYPMAADFRFDSRVLLATNYSQIMLFDVQSHVGLGGWTPGNNGSCQYSEPRTVRWSPRGRFVYALAPCGYGGNTTNILYASVPAPSASADFNGDGKPDLLWSNTANGATFLWYMNGPALSSDAFVTQIDPSWKIQGVADFNGDGKPDLVWRNTATGNTYVWYMNGPTLVSDAFLFSLPPEWVIQGVADFNGDGKPDFLMRNTSTGVAFAWFFNDNVAIGDQFLFSIDPQWKVEAVADLNADGQPDLLFRNMSSGLAFAWNTQYAAGTLSLTSSSAPIFGIDPVWEIVQMADWNGDGNADLLFRNRNSGVVFVWYMTGTTLGGSNYITQIDPSWEIVPHP